MMSSHAVHSRIFQLLENYLSYREDMTSLSNEMKRRLPLSGEDPPRYMFHAHGQDWKGELEIALFSG